MKIIPNTIEAILIDYYINVYISCNGIEFQNKYHETILKLRKKNIMIYDIKTNIYDSPQIEFELLGTGISKIITINIGC